MTVSPFLLLKRSTADLIADNATAALARWAAAWSLPADATVTCAPLGDESETLATSSEWRHYSLASGTSAWVHIQTGLARHLEQALFDLDGMDGTSEKHRSSGIAMSVAEEALEELSSALVGEVTDQAVRATQPSPVPNRLFRPGSGTALCTVCLDGKSLRLLLPAESTPLEGKPTSQANRPSLARLQHALEAIPVTLSVEVSHTELTLGYLRTLAVGDVLALPTSVDHPLRVTGSDDTTICHAHLGSLMGFHAVELLRPAD